MSLLAPIFQGFLSILGVSGALFSWPVAFFPSPRLQLIFVGFGGMRFLTFCSKSELAPRVFEVFRISGFPVPVRERDYLKVIYLSWRCLPWSRRSLAPGPRRLCWFCGSWLGQPLYAMGGIMEPHFTNSFSELQWLFGVPTPGPISRDTTPLAHRPPGHQRGQLLTSWPQHTIKAQI